MTPFDSRVDEFRQLIDGLIDGLLTFDEAFIPYTTGGPAFNGRGNVTDAEVARRRTRNKNARQARRKNRRTNTEPATARDALDATYAAIVRLTSTLPMVSYDNGPELAGLASLAATLHHQAELEGTTP